MFLILTDEGNPVEDIPPAVIVVAEGLKADDSGDDGKRVKPVRLSEAEMTIAIRFLTDHPFMWLTGTDDYVRRKKEAKYCWDELAAKFHLSGEYNFFLFVIVSTGDVSLD